MKSCCTSPFDLTDVGMACRKGDIAPDEVLVRVEVPWPGESDSVHVFKQAHRREDDIAIVNAAIRLRTAVNDTACTIEKAWLAFGGVGPTIIRCEETATHMVGKALTRETAMVRATQIRSANHFRKFAPEDVP